MEKIARGLTYILLLFLMIFGGAETEKMADYIYLVVLPTVAILFVLLILHLAQKMHVPRTASEITDSWARKRRQRLFKLRGLI